MIRRWIQFLALFLAWLPGGVSLAVAGDEVGLVRLGETWRVTTAFEGNPAWKDPGFKDFDWSQARSGFSNGYGTYDESTSLPLNLSKAYFLRKSFTVENPASIQALLLRIDYRDAFVAYLNGVEIARRGFATPEGFPVPVDAQAVGRIRDVPEEMDVSGFIASLRKGSNLLAIQFNSASRDGYGMACVPELMANFSRGPLVQNASTNSIYVLWKTLLPSQGVVEFGTGPELGRRAATAGPNTNHAVQLAPLQPGTRYYYRVLIPSTNDVQAASAISSFTTLKSSGDFRIGLTHLAGAKNYH